MFSLEGEILKTIRGKDKWEYTNSAIFNINATEIIAATDNLIRIFDEETTEEICSLEGHTKTVLCLHLNFIGTTLYSGANDGSIRVWDYNLR